MALAAGGLAGYIDYCLGEKKKITTPTIQLAPGLDTKFTYNPASRNYSGSMEYKNGNLDLQFKAEENVYSFQLKYSYSF
ncbi:MAG: hypothetical protein ACYC7L_03855 [Nitrospirota bacterium]